MFRIFLSFTLTTFVFVFAATSVEAQSKKELAAQDAIIFDRLGRLESRMLTGDPAAERLMQRMDSLEEAMRTLTGDVERLRFERDSLRTDVQTLASQLEGLQALATRTQTHLDAVDMVAQNPMQGRFQSSTNGSIAGTVGGPVYTTPSSGLAGGTTPQADPYFAQGGTTDPNQPNAVSPAPSFGEQTIGVQQFGGASASVPQNNVADLPATGQQKLAEGDFSGAQTAFSQYLAINPDAPDAGDVSYWLGESYFVRGGYADAADAYISAMRKAPNGQYAPSAMVGLAATMRELGKTSESCAALNSFPSQYPNAPEAVRQRARTERARAGC